MNRNSRPKLSFRHVFGNFLGKSEIFAQTSHLLFSTNTRPFLLRFVSMPPLGSQEFFGYRISPIAQAEHGLNRLILTPRNARTSILFPNPQIIRQTIVSIDTSFFLVRVDLILSFPKEK